MKYGAISSAVLMPLIASCMSGTALHAPAQSATAASSSPVRSARRENATLLHASTPARDGPPAELTNDYMPSPWSIFFEPKTDRPTSGSRIAIERIASMISRFPTMGVHLCSVGSSAPDKAGIGDHGGDRERLDVVRALLARHGVQRVQAGPDRLCGSLARRPEAFVLMEPAID